MYSKIFATQNYITVHFWLQLKQFKKVLASSLLVGGSSSKFCELSSVSDSIVISCMLNVSLRTCFLIFALARKNDMSSSSLKSNQHK